MFRVYIPAHNPVYGGELVRVTDNGVTSEIVYGPGGPVGEALIEPLQAALQVTLAEVIFGVTLDGWVMLTVVFIGQREASLTETV